MAQPTLEQYVATRYLQDLTTTGYQPVCQEADEMLEDALKILAKLNQATQFVKSQLRSSPPIRGIAPL